MNRATIQVKNNLEANVWFRCVKLTQIYPDKFIELRLSQNDLYFQIGESLYDHFEPSEVSQVR